MNEPSTKLRTITSDFRGFQTPSPAFPHVVLLTMWNTGVAHPLPKLKPLAPLGSRALDIMNFLFWKTRPYEPGWRQLSPVPSCQAGKCPLAQGGSKLCSIQTAEEQCNLIHSWDHDIFSGAVIQCRIPKTRILLHQYFFTMQKKNCVQNKSKIIPTAT